MEDFTTYTKVDPLGVIITHTATQVRWSGLGHAMVVYVYKDKGANHFNGNFIHYLTFQVNNATNAGQAAHWVLANAIGGFTALKNNNDNLISLQAYKVAAPSPLWRMELSEVYGGSVYSSSYYGFSTGTPYYLKIVRDESAGTYGTLYCYIYSDAARTNLLATLSRVLHSKEDFQYVYCCQSYNNPLYNDTNYINGFTDSLDLLVPGTVTTDAASDTESATATLNGTLDDDGGEVCACGFEWGETTAYGNTTSTQSKNTGGSFAQAITGLSPKTTYHYRAIATNSAGTSYGSDRTFTTLAAEPSATTDPATGVEQTTVTMNGTLDDDGGEACDCGFEYGETTDYGSTTATESKNTGETFAQEVRGLKGGTVYHFRAIATNTGGTGHGVDKTFHTEALSAEAHQALGKGYPLSRAEL